LEFLQDINGIYSNYTNATEKLDLTSDHTRIFATLSTSITLRKSKPRQTGISSGKKLISPNYKNATANLDLTSDRTPSIANISTSLIVRIFKPRLRNS
jgi:hypothetical protein